MLILLLHITLAVGFYIIVVGMTFVAVATVYCYIYGLNCCDHFLFLILFIDFLLHLLHSTS